MNFIEEIESLQNSAISLYRSSDEKVFLIKKLKHTFKLNFF